MSGANGATEFADVVGTLDELRALMGEPSEIALRKDIGRLDEHCRAFIARWLDPAESGERISETRTGSRARGCRRRPRPGPEARGTGTRWRCGPG